MGPQKERAEIGRQQGRPACRWGMGHRALSSSGDPWARTGVEMGSRAVGGKTYGQRSYSEL